MCRTHVCMHCGHCGQHMIAVALCVAIYLMFCWSGEQKRLLGADLKPFHHAFPFPDDPTMMSAMMLNPALRERMLQDAAKVAQSNYFGVTKSLL